MFCDPFPKKCTNKSVLRLLLLHGFGVLHMFIINTGSACGGMKSWLEYLIGLGDFDQRGEAESSCLRIPVDPGNRFLSEQ